MLNNQDKIENTQNTYYLAFKGLVRTFKNQEQKNISSKCTFKLFLISLMPYWIPTEKVQETRKFRAFVTFGSS
jgi:hypothetical protein